MALPTRWPEAWDSLAAELNAGRGRPALIDMAAAGAPNLVGSLADQVDRVVSIGTLSAEGELQLTTLDRLAGRSNGSMLLLDIDVLFTPALGLDVMSHLRRTAQHGPVVVAWPGRISSGRLSYSLPGRADHFDEPARDLVVLRPVPSEFPDEVPYTLERFPA